jgi:hypothetical protein
MCDLFKVERFTLPSLPSLSIQNFCDFAITMMIKQPVDLGDHLRLRLANLRDGQWLSESESSRGAAAEAHMDLDHFSVDQRHILDEQTQNTFSLARFDARIIPDTWKISRQGEQLLLCL